MSGENGHTTLDEKQLAPLPSTSVQSEPLGGLFSAPGGNTMTLYLAQAADDIPAWGTAWGIRDRLLRELWPTEPMLAGVIPTIAARNAALSWKLDGPTRTVETVQTMLQSADFGGGWLQFIIKLTLDLLTQDNGAFMEVMREGLITGEQALHMVERGQPLPPVTGIAHLDSACCIRTGNRTTPVIYTDPDNGSRHEMPWHMVIPLSEMPSPIKRMRNMQYSALTRILRSAQIFRDYGIYKREKISGRFTKSITIVGGPKQTELDDRLKRDQEQANNAGLVRYMLPTILASVDPTKPVSVATIELAALPDGFDYDAELRWYITQLALTFLEDYQTFAPLPGGNLGTSQQSIVLERKGRGKGVALWTKGMTHIFNFWGIMPRTVSFEFDETDTQADKDKADLLSVQVSNMVSLVQSGLMSAPVARQYMADNSIVYDEDYLAMQGEEDATPDETVTDEQPLTTTGDIDSLVDGATTATIPDNELPASGEGEPVDAPGTVVPSGGEPVAAQALNGAQVSSLLEIVALYSAGELSKPSATAIINASFPFLSADIINSMLDTSGTVIPAPASEPFNVEQPLDNEQVPLQTNGILPRLLKWLNGQQVTRTKASDAEGLIADFSESIHGAVSDYLAGGAKRTSQNAFVRAIESAWPEVAEVGYSDGGGDWQDADEDDTTADDTADQVSYALGYWDSLPDIRKDEGTPDARTDLYVQSLRAVYNKYKLLGAGNKQVTWEYGDTDHCPTCASLNGQKHGAKWFIKRGYIPRESGSDTLDCKGFNCACRLVDDDGEDFSI